LPVTVLESTLIGDNGTWVMVFYGMHHSTYIALGFELTVVTVKVNNGFNSRYCHWIRFLSGGSLNLDIVYI
jgi:hypothetical protein